MTWSDPIGTVVKTPIPAFGMEAGRSYNLFMFKSEALKPLGSDSLKLEREIGFHWVIGSSRP